MGPDNHAHQAVFLEFLHRIAAEQGHQIDELALRQHFEGKCVEAQKIIGCDEKDLTSETFHGNIAAAFAYGLVDSYFYITIGETPTETEGYRRDVAKYYALKEVLKNYLGQSAVSHCLASQKRGLQDNYDKELGTLHQALVLGATSLALEVTNQTYSIHDVTAMAKEAKILIHEYHNITEMMSQDQKHMPKAKHTPPKNALCYKFTSCGSCVLKPSPSQGFLNSRESNKAHKATLSTLGITAKPASAKEENFAKATAQRINDLSALNLYEAGQGSSSSHGFGPQKFAKLFRDTLIKQGLFSKGIEITVFLYDSLGASGKAHKIERSLYYGIKGLKLNLDDYTPSELSTGFEIWKESGNIPEDGITLTVHYLPENLLFGKKTVNGMLCVAWGGTGKAKKPLHWEAGYSIGGGYIKHITELYPQSEASAIYTQQSTALSPQKTTIFETERTYDFTDFQSLLAITEEKTLSVSALMEHYSLEDLGITAEHMHYYLNKIRYYMLDQAEEQIDKTRHADTGQILLSQILLKNLAQENQTERQKQLRIARAASQATMDDVALSGKLRTRLIVKGPTLGSAGVIPGTLSFLRALNHSLNQEKQAKIERDFLQAAAAFLKITKQNGTHAAAAGGCQAEIGNSAMAAAAALTEARGGSIKQMLFSALLTSIFYRGLTCTPEGGYVGNPCNIRNALAQDIILTASDQALARKDQDIDDNIAARLDAEIAIQFSIGGQMRELLREKGYILETDSRIQSMSPESEIPTRHGSRFNSSLLEFLE